MNALSFHFVRVLGLALSASLCFAAVASEALGPQDFAEGAQLRSRGQDAFYRVDLPHRVYVGTAWPDLRDIRVFNSRHESLPFSLIRTTEQGNHGDAPTRRSMRSFRLSGDPAQLGGSAVVINKTLKGVSLQLPEDKPELAETEYLLRMPEQGLERGIQQLHLRWPVTDKNWEGRVTVEASENLLEWVTLTEDHPIMDLRNGADRLVQGDVPVSDAAGSVSRQYFRLRISGAGVPTLTDIEASAPAYTVTPAVVDIDLTGSIDREGHAVYSLLRPLNVSTLRILPTQRNTVMLVGVDYRSDPNGPWTSLDKVVAYRTNTASGERVSDAVKLNTELMVQGIRLRALGSSWGDSIPSVTAVQPAYTLVFNARDGGPYLMAWGSMAASEQTALPIHQLLPATQDVDVDLVAVAATDAVEPLGGESRLQVVEPRKKRQAWHTAAMWIALIGSALLLATLAWRMWREVSGASKTSDKM